MNKAIFVSIRIISIAICYLASFSVTVADDKLGHKMSSISTPVSAPDFLLENMDEEKLSMNNYRGKVLLLNFWATWCPPCRKEIPSMERLHQKFKNNNFAVLAVNQMEDIDHVFAFTGELEVDPTFTILFDKNSEVSLSYKVQGLPTSYLIDKQGRIRFRAIGGREFDHPEVEKKIQQLMNE